MTLAVFLLALVAAVGWTLLRGRGGAAGDPATRTGDGPGRPRRLGRLRGSGGGM